jgi:hypothetical protein
MRKPGFPRQSYDEEKQIKQLEKIFAKPELIQEYYISPSRDKRDEIINGRLTLINLNYNKFVSEFCFTKQSIDMTSEMAELGVNLATTAVGGAGTKTILGAISSGLSGAKIAIDKNFFYERTVPVLVASMNAQRKEASIPILTGMTNSIEKYPLHQGLSDLDNYYFAGTFLGALQTIQAEAGEKEMKAEVNIEKIRSFSFMEDDADKQLTAFLWPQGMEEADGTEKEANAENLKALRKWMEEKKLDDIAIAEFLHNKLFTSARNQAVKDLNLLK